MPHAVKGTQNPMAPRNQHGSSFQIIFNVMRQHKSNMPSCSVIIRERNSW